MLEPVAWKRARPVLRGPRRGNAPGLPDEVETVYLEIKSTMLGGRVLRSCIPAAVDQEIHALLAAYQILRIAIVDEIGRAHV